QLRHQLAVERDRRAGNRAGAERHDVDAFARVVEPIRVAREHLHIGEQMMRKQHRLGALEMRVAWDDNVCILRRECDEAALQVIWKARWSRRCRDGKAASRMKWIRCSGAATRRSRI